ncbi:hypothetical protein [Thalassotalea sp. PLHSN55]|uniref:hypothetical protein n=1 Tax=Thalassotalea sp. PLHSN55 TaxID=3435888 RepID=UPI003F82C6F6
MLIIRITLFLVAFLMVLYPFWGVIYPASYLNELVETFSFAQQAKPEQVQQAALLHLLPNSAFALALFCLAKFIQNPSYYKLAKFAALGFLLYPILLVIGDIFIASVLSQPDQQESVAIELSGQKLFYILLAMIVWAIAKSQYEYQTSDK